MSTRMERIRHDVYEKGQGLIFGDAYILFEEYKRLSTEHEQLLAVLRDAAEERGVGEHMAKLEAEVTRLQQVVLQLREHLDWDTTQPEYRYTATME